MLEDTTKRTLPGCHGSIGERTITGDAYSSLREGRGRGSASTGVSWCGWKHRAHSSAIRKAARATLLGTIGLFASDCVAEEPPSRAICTSLHACEFLPVGQTVAACEAQLSSCRASLSSSAARSWGNAALHCADVEYCGELRPCFLEKKTCIPSSGVPPDPVETPETIECSEGDAPACGDQGHLIVCDQGSWVARSCSEACELEFKPKTTSTCDFDPNQNRYACRCTLDWSCSEFQDAPSCFGETTLLSCHDGSWEDHDCEVECTEYCAQTAACDVGDPEVLKCGQSRSNPEHDVCLCKDQ